MSGCDPGTPEDGRRLPILRLKCIRDCSTALIGQPGGAGGGGRGAGGERGVGARGGGGVVAAAAPKSRSFELLLRGVCSCSQQPKAKHGTESIREISSGRTPELTSFYAASPAYQAKLVQLSSNLDGLFRTLNLVSAQLEISKMQGGKQRAAKRNVEGIEPASGSPSPL